MLLLVVTDDDAVLVQDGRAGHAVISRYCWGGGAGHAVISRY